MMRASQNDVCQRPLISSAECRSGREFSMMGNAERSRITVEADSWVCPLSTQIYIQFLKNLHAQGRASGLQPCPLHKRQCNLPLVASLGVVGVDEMLYPEMPQRAWASSLVRSFPPPRGTPARRRARAPLATEGDGPVEDDLSPAPDDTDASRTVCSPSVTSACNVVLRATARP